MFKRHLLTALVTLSISGAAMAESMPVPMKKDALPVSYHDVFKTASENPDVMIYFGDKAYAEKRYDDALKAFLDAARYGHAAGIKNSMYMIEKGLGADGNRSTVVDFLSYYANPEGGQAGNVFAQVYLGDYYRGDICVWKQEKSCDAPKQESLAHEAWEKSYFYYEKAAYGGNDRARYSTGMMSLLGLGVPRNVPLAVNWLTPLAENGNGEVAYILGHIFQHGFWVTQDRERANKWFTLSAQTGNAEAAMYLAKNAEAGLIGGETTEERTEFAKAHYMKALTAVQANAEQVSEANYRLGLLFDAHPSLKDNGEARKFMRDAAKKNTSHGVKALMWLGDQYSGEQTAAVAFYKAATEMLETLPLHEQQRLSAAWQRLANSYARLGDDVKRDERLYARYMNKYNVMMSKTVMPKVEPTAFAKYYDAFTFPG